MCAGLPHCFSRLHRAPLRSRPWCPMWTDRGWFPVSCYFSHCRSEQVVHESLCTLVRISVDASQKRRFLSKGRKQPESGRRRQSPLCAPWAAGRAGFPKAWPSGCCQMISQILHNLLKVV